jgi:hypothetical protein
MNGTPYLWAATALMALSILGPIGCSRAQEPAEGEVQASTPPAMPDPVESNEETEASAEEVPEELSSNMYRCAQHWDFGSLWSQLHSSYRHGQFDAYPLSGLGGQFPRGLKSRSVKGFSCMNRLLKIAALLHQISPYFPPGAIENYLYRMSAWGYQGSPYYGGGGDSPLL